MKLSKEKRNQLVLAVIGTVGVVALMWFNLISPRQAALLEARTAKNSAESKLKDIQNAIKNADAIASGLTNVTQAFSRAGDDMASGDLYSWIYDTIRAFKTPYRVDIPEVSHPEVSDVNLLPSFPFKQVKFTIHGTAYYHDLGKFIADFENTFPHIRLVNLEIQPASSGNDGKLSFKMDVIALVKSTS
jgi:Tfp pilus assembly protein PilO